MSNTKLQIEGNYNNSLLFEDDWIISTHIKTLFDPFEHKKIKITIEEIQ
jgi:hypothetical protein